MPLPVGSPLVRYRFVLYALLLLLALSIVVLDRNGAGSSSSARMPGAASHPTPAAANSDDAED